MSKFVKSLGVAALVCGFVMAVAGQDGGTNLLKQWSVSNKNNTVIQDDGVIACECKVEKENSGVEQIVALNQTEPKTIEFSAESRAENVSGDISLYDYSIYIDIVHTDGTAIHAISVAFKTGTHDWEKASSSYTPAKPVASLSYYLLFRNKTGKVWFKNAVLIQK